MAWTLDTRAGYVRTLGLFERVTFDDLARAVPLAAEWQRRGLAVPLLLSRHEFERTLDVFPLEYGNIIASHVVIVGDRSVCRDARRGRRSPPRLRAAGQESPHPPA